MNVIFKLVCIKFVRYPAHLQNQKYFISWCNNNLKQHLIQDFRKQNLKLKIK